MMTKTGLNDQARALAKDNGLSLVRAVRYSALIGDTPELACDGRVIVRDRRGREIAKVILRIANGKKLR